MANTAMHIGLFGVLAVMAPACTDEPATAEESAALERHGDGDSDFPVIPNLPSPPTLVVSTVPPSGDVNPYGVAFVPHGFPDGGKLHPGDILVSNFNNSANVQGTGSSIVDVHPDGTQTLFFQGPPGLGLSTALVVLRSGFVIVGNVPSLDGSGVCTQVGDQMTGVGQGSLIVLDKYGHVVRTIESRHFLDGPWDMTAHDDDCHPTLFVSNVLNGTVSRVDLDVHDEHLKVERFTRIASGYVHRCDPAAFVIGPTGLALGHRDILYVAATGDNKIFAVHDALDRHHDAGRGEVFIADDEHLHGPLGLVIAPNGDFLTTQGDAVNPDPNQVSELVEYDRHGHFIAQTEIAPEPGAAFGLAIRPFHDGFILAAVNDATNELDVWKVP